MSQADGVETGGPLGAVSYSIRSQANIVFRSATNTMHIARNFSATDRHRMQDCTVICAARSLQIER